MHTALIIDDESDARSVMRKMLELYCPQFSRILLAATAQHALQQLREEVVDLIFLDIKLKGPSGLEIYAELARYCDKIVFVTAYKKHAFAAFRNNPLHYLLKPVNPDDLTEAVRRADLSSRRIVIVNTHRRTPLNFDDILYLHSDGPYVQFHTTDKRVVTGTHGLKYYEEKLNSPEFCRPHQSYVVNLGAVQQVRKEEGPFGTVYLKGVDEPITMSRRLARLFVEALENYH